MIDVRSYVVNTTLKNGAAATIRAIRPDDHDRLARAFRGLEPETGYTRFFRYVRELTDEDLTRATQVNSERQVALVVTVGSGVDEVIIGGGRYIVCGAAGGERNAELAFMVEEDFQGLGIASQILQHLVKIGRQQEVSCFTAEVLSRNQSMLHVFAGCRLPMKQRRDGDVVHVDLPLGGPSPRTP